MPVTVKDGPIEAFKYPVRGYEGAVTMDSDEDDLDLGDPNVFRVATQHLPRDKYGSQPAEIELDIRRIRDQDVRALRDVDGGDRIGRMLALAQLQDDRPVTQAEPAPQERRVDRPKLPVHRTPVVITQEPPSRSRPPAPVVEQQPLVQPEPQEVEVVFEIDGVGTFSACYHYVHIHGSALILGFDRNFRGRQFIPQERHAVPGDPTSGNVPITVVLPDLNKRLSCLVLQAFQFPYKGDDVVVLLILDAE